MKLLFSKEKSSYYFPLNLRKKVISVISSLLKITTDYEVSLTLISDETMQEYNLKYRNIDRTTDVLSFAFLEKGLIDEMLGDIYISFPKAKAQSKEYGHSLERELAFLLIHGILHLLGYDHLKKKDEKIMFDLQKEIIKEVLSE
ncbi:MAG: rRNA maturation RNase YbeY [Bacillales bacterium]|jgi:probable rRNA maturation factor|nr:rRNA maturation RNase YbeY [Bacillales bacterium]